MRVFHGDESIQIRNPDRCFPGIGQAISSLLMASGLIVAGIDTVNPESPVEHFLPMNLADIAKPDEQTAMQAFLSKVDAQARITTLVNNAAVQELGTFDEVSAEMLNWLLPFFYRAFWSSSMPV